MTLAHLLQRAYREVEALLRIVPIGEQHVRPPDGVAVDGEATGESRIGRFRKTGLGDVAAGRAVNRLTPVDAADDVADVAPVDKKLVRLLNRSAVGPGDELRRAQNGGRQQPVVGVGHPARLAVDASRVHQPVGLVQIEDVRDVDEPSRPPRDPRARLVAADYHVDASEAPRVQGHEERRGGHLDGFAKWEPARQLGQERAHPNLVDQVGITTRRIDGGRVALDLEPAPPQSEHLLDDDALATPRIREPAVKDRHSSRPGPARATAAAHKQEADEAERQRITRGDRVVQDDGPGGDRRAQPQAPAQDEGAGHLQAADIARSGRHREREQQSRICRHRLQGRDWYAQGPEKEAEVEGVDGEGDSGQRREARRESRRP